MYIKRLFKLYSTSEKNIVEDLFNSIINLKLFEAQALSEKLKAEFKISDINIIGHNSNPIQIQDPAQDLPKKEIKTEFNVILQKIDASNKAKIIREIKSLLPALNLVEAKNFVESVPKLIKDKVKSEEAKAIKTTLEGLGAQVSLE
jgi:large subunit ribosomal protein L7/L12